MTRLGLNRPRQEVWSIRLDHQPVQGNFRGELPDGEAASLVADPAGQPHVEAGSEVGLQLRARAREAMYDSFGNVREIVSEQVHEVGVRVALVQEDGLADPGGQLELVGEGTALVHGWREVAEVIEPALSGRADERVAELFLQRGKIGSGEFLGVMRMNAGRGAEQPRPGFADRDGAGIALHRAAGDHHADDAGVERPRDDLGAVVVVAVVGEVDADVDEARRLHEKRLLCDNGRTPLAGIWSSAGAKSFYRTGPRPGVRAQATGGGASRYGMSLDQDALEALRKDQSGKRPRYDTRTSERRRRWIVGAGLAVAAVVAWFLFGGSKPQEVTVATVQPPSAPGETTVLSASGYVVARRLATVSSKVTGRITEVRFEEGARVEAGQVLAHLDDSTVRAAYEVAARQLASARTAVREVEVRLAEAVRERDRLRELRKDSLVSVSALDAAEAEAAALAARLDSARAEAGVAEGTVRVRAQELDDLVIRAPFAGVIISKDAQPGEMVSPISAGGGFTRTGIATVVDMDSREIEVDVNEAYINRVAEGQRAEAVLDAYPDRGIPCRVIAIVPTADRQKATVRVRIAIDELEDRILPDMGVRVRFYEDGESGSPSAVARVPTAAVVTDSAGEHVWGVAEGRVSRRPVRLGREMDDLREVLEGLAPGDSVVVDVPAGLEDGDKIVVRGPG